jgi:hypothetical protein
MFGWFKKDKVEIAQELHLAEVELALFQKQRKQLVDLTTTKISGQDINLVYDTIRTGDKHIAKLEEKIAELKEGLEPEKKEKK